jgi:hypothetical protein
MPASGWAGGCRFKLELGACGTLPALPGRLVVLKWKASSALLKGRKLAALHAEWRRAACSCAVVWLPVTVPVDCLTPARSWTFARGHVRMCRKSAIGACASRAGGHVRHAQGHSACSAACPMAFPARRLRMQRDSLHSLGHVCFGTSTRLFARTNASSFDRRDASAHRAGVGFGAACRRDRHRCGQYPAIPSLMGSAHS